MSFKFLMKSSEVLVRRVICPNLPGLTRGTSSHEIVRHMDLEDHEFECRYANIFNKMDIDGWQVRKVMSDLHGMDLVPTPPIIEAALRACRRLNDYALAIRFLEAVHFKCGGRKEIWAYITQEIQPTLDELGLETPDKLGYDKPELALRSVYEDH